MHSRSYFDRKHHSYYQILDLVSLYKARDTLLATPANVEVSRYHDELAHKRLDMVLRFRSTWLEYEVLEHYQNIFSMLKYSQRLRDCVVFGHLASSMAAWLLSPLRKQLD